jgi:outer membrane immunogenic protein
MQVRLAQIIRAQAGRAVAAVGWESSMSRLVFAAIALTGAGFAVSAQAADIPYYGSRPPPYAGPLAAVQPYDCYTWAGPYLGGNLGYAWGSVDNNRTKPSGFVGGVQAGYNWQPNPSSPSWVFGVEGDFQVTGADETFAPWKFSNPWFGTVRGRAGYAFSNILVYGTAGLAFGELRGETFGLSESHGNAGWTAGVGAEFGFGQTGLTRGGWSAKVEYLYVDLANSNFTITGVPNGYRFGTLRAGINYHF